MDPKRIDRSIKTGELQLNLWDKIGHYWMVVFLFCISGPFLYAYVRNVLNGNSTLPDEMFVWIMFLPSSLGVLVLWMQKRRLKFKSIETALTKDELIAIVAEVGKELKWTPYISEDRIIVAKTSLTIWSWGERVTIIFDENKVLINSICDPDKKTSITAMGKNKRNEKTLIERIRKTELLTSCSLDPCCA